MPAPDSTLPGDFNDIFRQGVLVVGGHAVNLWASYYAHKKDPQLAAFEPFVSKDADIHLRDKDVALGIATAAGWTFRDNPEVRSPILGQIVMIRMGKELTVDVLRSVSGLNKSDLNKTEEIVFKGGIRYAVPAPEIMLKAKIANLVLHDQRDRQDDRHARMMVVCCRHYLVDIFDAMKAGQVKERDAVNRFMSTYDIITSEQAQRADQQHQLGVAAAIPPESQLPKLSEFVRLQAFYHHQVRAKSSRVSNRIRF